MDPHCPATSLGDADRSSSRISASPTADPSAQGDLEESDRVDGGARAGRGNSDAVRQMPRTRKTRPGSAGHDLRDRIARADVDGRSQPWRWSR